MHTLRGLIENKHLPPHNGHLYMCEWSLEYLRIEAEKRAYNDYRLYIMVCTRSSEKIDAFDRFEWTKALFAQYPNVIVVHANNVQDHFPEYTDYGDHEMWARAAYEMCQLPRMDLFFASEDYGPGIAKHLGARFIACDKDRTSVPASGTEVREDPIGCWDFIPRVERPFFAKKVCIIGAEYTGKTELAKHLAEYYKTVYVPEYANKIYNNKERSCNLRDLEEIAACHLAARKALLRQCNRLLISDTSIISTAAWLEEIYPYIDDSWIFDRQFESTDHLYLFLDPTELEHIPGNTHKTRESWLAFSDKLKRVLDMRDLPYVVLPADDMQRKQIARCAIRDMEWDRETFKWKVIK